jgi:hypothetical protein
MQKEQIRFCEWDKMCQNKYRLRIKRLTFDFVWQVRFTCISFYKATFRSPNCTVNFRRQVRRLGSQNDRVAETIFLLEVSVCAQLSFYLFIKSPSFNYSLTGNYKLKGFVTVWGLCMRDLELHSRFSYTHIHARENWNPSKCYLWNIQMNKKTALGLVYDLMCISRGNLYKYKI